MFTSEQLGYEVLSFLEFVLQVSVSLETLQNKTLFACVFPKRTQTNKPNPVRYRLNLALRVIKCL